MKKKIFAAILAATLTVSMGLTAFAADTESKLIGKFTFDESVKNEVTGTDATTIANQVSAAAPDVTWAYTDGVDGKALLFGAENAKGAGLNFGVAPTGTSYTISAWLKMKGGGGWTPILFAGSTNQSPESWVGLKANGGAWKTLGPALASNGGTVDGTANQRIEIAGTACLPDDKELDWINMTLVVEEGAGKLYYNGILVNMTATGAVLPDITKGADPTTVTVLLGANAWADPQLDNAAIDDLYIYDRALASEDVAQLVKDTNKSGATLLEFTAMKEPTTMKPSASDGKSNGWVTSTEEESSMSPVVIGVIIAVVIAVVVVVVVVLTKSKKKGSNDDEE